MRLRLILFSSFLISLVLTPFLVNFSRKLKILDYPAERKIHDVPMPRLGGVAIYLATVASLFFGIFSSAKLTAIFWGGTLIFLLGLADDIRGISASSRLLGQIIASVILISSGISIDVFPGPFNFLNYLITVVWIVGITNAVNYLDGVDGLATLLGISILGCFTYIGFISNQFWLLNLIVALGAALLGFLRYNFPKAKVFLGDSGSNFIGFVLGAIGIMGTWAQDSVVKIFVPVFILGVPIFDMCFTTVMRIKEKKIHDVLEWLEYAGKDHFHHRLMNLGLSRIWVVYLICATSMILGISGIVLYNSERADAYFMLAQAFFIFIIISILMVMGGKTSCKEQS
ncbi:MAG: undecaprenyl/decaprenyl-phosphate alpha-N-acetylglucosaminyl 1-phosphate transferase [Candidatus Omnitrophica bacterium]|nr:undecaprenyl/decaprenyl-phosphate alpha-N-acetylglucosaminyl 1-phosphate transferase [Candidatus Omnitrophota bacterium]